MLQLADQIFETGDKNQVSTIMAINQSAAFDSIEHKILLEKLKIYNFDEHTRNWVEDYLSNRTQYVMVGGVESAMKPVYQGIPQGSVLGPALLHICEQTFGIN